MVSPKTTFLLAFAFSLLRVSSVEYQDVFYGEYKLRAGDPAFNFLPIMRNHNQPKPCEASWAFAITTTMSVHFNLLNKGKALEVDLSPQMLINCANQPFSCANADDYNIEGTFEQLKTFGIAEESCNNYYASDVKDCSKQNRCKDCEAGRDGSSICHTLNYHSYKLNSWKKITSSRVESNKNSDLFDKIYLALKNNGALVCKINHSEELFKVRTANMERYVPTDRTEQEYTAWVSLVGFKTLNRDKSGSWVLQTSYGDNVGFHGYVSIDADADSNFLNLLDNCYEIEVNPQVEYVDNKEVEDPVMDLLKFRRDSRDNKAFEKNYNQGYTESTATDVTYNEGLQIRDDFKPIDWRNVHGRNFLTYVRNHHIPSYCGSCWIQNTTSTLADRANIANFKQNIVFPRHSLSTQAVINCNKGGSCNGGNADEFFQEAMNWTVPLETCKIYEAKNPDSFSCTPHQVCSNNSRKGVYDFTQYNGMRVANFGSIKGPLYMKAALQDGPIACSMQCTKQFDEYKKNADGSINVYDEELPSYSYNHIVSIVGWGTYEKGEYWIVRNSWSKEWGYDGLFYIKAGNNSLGMEGQCYWANPRYVPFSE